MRIAILFISLLLINFNLRAQLEETYTQRLPVDVPECVALQYKLQKLVPNYLQRGYLDSIQFILGRQKRQCPDEYSGYHTEVILQLYLDSFEVDDPEVFLEELIRYRQEQEFISDNKEGLFDPWAYNYYPDWDTVAVRYYTFLQQFASDGMNNVKAEGLRGDLLRFYAGEYDELLRKLKREKYTQNEVQEEYNEEVRSLIYDEGALFAVYAGYWQPIDNLSALGPHPEIGFQLGYFKEKMKLGLTAGVRFVDSPEPYRYRKNDSNYVTDNFTAFQIGAEAGYAVWKGARNELDLNLGVAYDGITVVAGDEEAGEPTVMMSTLNVNAGIEYRFYYNLKNYVALDARYHFLNYKNNINSEMNGDAWTLRLIWGFTSSTERRRELKALGY